MGSTLKRILTAAVLIPLVVALVLWAPGWLFALAVLPFVWLALWEYLELAGRTGPVPTRWTLYLLSLGLLLAAWLTPGQLLAVLVGAVLVVLGVELFRGPALVELLPTASAGLFGLFYTTVPFALMIELRDSGQSRRIILYALLLIWIGDTAAYFAGRAVGRHKLAPTISPGKTVEGSVASLVATLGIGFWLFRLWFPSFAVAHAILLPLSVNLLAQVGDLAESALKRGAGVKDSSTVLPGHGGMLDRIDSLLFALPGVWYYWNWLLLGGG